MLTSIDDIRSNPILNHFDEIVKSYGVNGAYANWLPNGLNEGGLYFLCGLDNSAFERQSFDMNTILDNIMMSRGHIRTDIAAFKIDRQHPLMIHRDIVNYCQQINVVQEVYRYFGKRIPIDIDPGIIEIMEIAWRQFLNTQRSHQARLKHKNSLIRTLDIIATGISPESPEYKEHDYLSKGYYDSGRGKIYNWLKKHFVKYKNEVSLEHLVNYSGNVNFATVTYKSFSAFKKAMAKRQDILYHVSNVRGEVLDVAPEDGFGSKEKNDRRFYTVHYPRTYTKDIEKILLSIDYPEEFNRTIAEVDPHGYGTEHIVVPDNYIDAFRSLCKQNEVKLCIDQSVRATVYGGIPIVFSAQYSAKVYNMLTKLSGVFERDIPPRVTPDNIL